MRSRSFVNPRPSAVFLVLGLVFAALLAPHQASAEQHQVSVERSTRPSRPSPSERQRVRNREFEGSLRDHAERLASIRRDRRATGALIEPHVERAVMGRVVSAAGSNDHHVVARALTAASIFASIPNAGGPRQGAELRAQMDTLADPIFIIRAEDAAENAGAITAARHLMSLGWERRLQKRRSVLNDRDAFYPELEFALRRQLAEGDGRRIGEMFWREMIANDGLDRAYDSRTSERLDVLLGLPPSDRSTTPFLGVLSSIKSWVARTPRSAGALGFVELISTRLVETARIHQTTREDGGIQMVSLAIALNRKFGPSPGFLETLSRRVRNLRLEDQRRFAGIESADPTRQLRAYRLLADRVRDRGVVVGARERSVFAR